MFDVDWISWLVSRFWVYVVCSCFLFARTWNLLILVVLGLGFGWLVDLMNCMDFGLYKTEFCGNLAFRVGFSFLRLPFLTYVVLAVCSVFCLFGFEIC